MYTFGIVVVVAVSQYLYCEEQGLLTPRTTSSAIGKSKRIAKLTMLASGVFLSGRRLCALFNEGNLMGSRMKNAG
jgi:hypothetical protein